MAAINLYAGPKGRHLCTPESEPIIGLSESESEMVDQTDGSEWATNSDQIHGRPK